MAVSDISLIVEVSTLSEHRLSGQVVWVTGSSRGIGRVIAGHLASLGARVAVHGTTLTSTRAFNEADSPDAVAQSIASAYHGEVLPVCGDLSDVVIVKQAADLIRQKFGQIDILVNCAGGDIGAQGTMGKNAGKPLSNDAVFISPEDIRTVLDRNLLTCIFCCREVAPEMIARKSGCIVNIGSISGLSGHAGEAIYSTAKAAVHEYTRCLAAQLRPDNIRVNVVAPGPIITPRFLASRPIDETKKQAAGTLDRYGQPIEIARAVEFLISPDSSYITGQVLRVDGGIQMWPA
jgi:3-oxoacyl-[acyl-carrier protein] reductase